MGPSPAGISGADRHEVAGKEELTRIVSRMRQDRVVETANAGDGKLGARRANWLISRRYREDCWPVTVLQPLAGNAIPEIK